MSIIITEDERQAILIALAKLSLERPGWLGYLEGIALKMDNQTPEGRAQMFEVFRRMDSDFVAAVLRGGAE